MPKRGKKGLQETEKEARPTDLTFASFLTGSLTVTTQTAKVPFEEHGAACSSELGPEKDQGETTNETVGFFVKRTKKGKLPISYENRAKGKKVTVISNVSGDPAILLHELKKKIGAGGVVRGESVEIQGDHQVLVENFLRSHKSCLK